MSTETNDSQKIAIIGMSCRLPGADNIHEFWENLVNEVDSISNFTDEELREAGVTEEMIQAPNYVKRRGIINGAEYFDASFFDVTPRDAELMDPQHRVFLECAWHALEDGGYNPETTDQRIGVFGGSGTNWHLNSASNNKAVAKYASSTSIVTSNDKDYIATRVSYKLNLTGPSLTVQSACSTSMSAVVMGVSSLLSYQSDMILAGGSTIELPEKQGYMYQEGSLVSSDGYCRTFDKRADGTVFSRGAGVVLLKRYEDAVRDGDNIHAVILGGAINNDGSSKVGFTAPSVEGQVNVALEALEISGVDAKTISYVEAHGTGTNVGDPIEVTSLKNVFETYSDEKQFCALGSVKTNIGHTDSASGVAGLIKTVLALKNKKIPAHLNFEEQNPKIKFEESPFYVNTKTSDWNSENNQPRRALVNSFGVGGTNACVIVEEAPVTKNKEEAGFNLLTLSAKSEKALIETRQNLSKFITENDSVNLSDMSYTFQIGRKAFDFRQSICFDSKEDLLNRLETENTVFQNLTSDTNKSIIFMFPGQGNQYLSMGKDLYEKDPEYRKVFDHCCNILKNNIGLELRDFIFAPEGSTEAKVALEQTYITQPAIFAVSYSMAIVLKNKGIEPEAMIGHSVGEYVAACLAGVMSLENAITLVAKRGELVQKLPGGSMLAILQNEDKILPFLFEGVEIAAVNNPGLTVVAGTDENITTLEENLKKAGFFSKKLSTSHAFHSAMMEPCLPEFATYFSNVTLSEPTIPIISTVTGNFLKKEEAMDPNYWVKHVREAVRFTDAVKTALDLNPTVFLEVGPGQSLESAVKHHLTPETTHGATRSMRTENEKFDDQRFLEEVVGKIWLNGGKINWEKYHNDENRLKLSLPVYPFQRKAYSIDFSQTNTGTIAEKKNTRKENTSDFYSIPSWKRTPHVEMLEALDEEKKTWILMKDQYGLSDIFRRQLLAKGDLVIELSQGDSYIKKDKFTYHINFGDKEHANQLIKDLIADENSIDQLLNLRNYKEDKSLFKGGDLDQIEIDTFFSNLYLIQALYTNNKLKNIHVNVIANGTFDIIGDEVYAPQNALSIGITRVLIQEFQTTRAKFIDCDIVAEEQKEQRVKHLISEAENKSYETVVAYRKNYRWVEGFDEVQLSKVEHPIYKDNGVYIITGGLGGIGLLSASTIADEVNAHFILTHQSPIPERNSWLNWLKENPEDSFMREKITGALALEAKGSTVHTREVDVANLDAMQKMVSDIENSIGLINGVIHSAGSVGGGIIPLKTTESVRPVFDSKFRGTVVLDQIFESKNLDFMWLYSSITSILGEATRLDYCAANAFLDAYVFYKNGRNKAIATTINWTAWDGTGMAARWEKEKTKKATHTRTISSKNLLSLEKKDENAEIYTVNFNPNEDWFINSHFIVSQPTVVGTTFIELIHQYAQLNYPNQTVEMKNIYFISPLMFENGKPKRVRMVVDLSKGKLKFSFKSQPIDKDPELHLWHDHFIGELVIETFTPSQIDLEGLKNKLANQIDETKTDRIVFNEQNESLIDLGERWDINNKIYIGENEWLAELSLREEFQKDVDQFDFHMSIMDKATSFALRFISESTFLPFSYKSVKPFKKLPATVYAYASVDQNNKTDDAVSIDITLISPAGEVLMEIKQYTMKQVNNLPTAEVNKKGKADFVQTAIDYINPIEGREVISKLLHSPNIPQIVVYPCDWNFMITSQIPNPEKKKEEQEKNVTKNYYARPEIQTSYEQPETEMEKTIAEIWQDILGIEKIGRNDTFTELGGNSLLAIQTIANIVDVLEVELSAQVFYDNPTIKGLAEAVVLSIMDLGDSEDLEGLIELMDLEDLE